MSDSHSTSSVTYKSAMKVLKMEIVQLVSKQQELVDQYTALIEIAGINYESIE